MVTLIDIVGSYYLQGMLDEYIPDQLISTLGIITIGLIIIYIIQQMMSFAKEYLLNVLSLRLVIDVILSYYQAHLYPAYVFLCDTADRGDHLAFLGCQSDH